MWSSTGSSNVEETTSARTERLKSVTSSGRSPTSTAIRWTSGWFTESPFAIRFRIVVLPAFGGETISPRWPFPIGVTRSISRWVTTRASVSRMSCSFGKIGVSASKWGRWRATSGIWPLTASTRSSPKYFSASLGGRTWPVTQSPVRSPKRRIWDCET